MIGPAPIADPTAISRFALAGKAHFTIRSKRTGTRFTYRVKLSDRGDVAFVGVLTGGDNESAYSYLGIIRIGPNGASFGRTAKSAIEADAPSAKAFAWFWRNVEARQTMDDLEFWHEGRCGRCARRLTVPESVASGFGPECIGRVAGGGFRAEAA